MTTCVIWLSADYISYRQAGLAAVARVVGARAAVRAAVRKAVTANVARAAAALA